MSSPNKLRCALILLYLNQVFCMSCDRYAEEPGVRTFTRNGKCYYAWPETGNYSVATSACEKPDVHVLFTETRREIKLVMEMLGPQSTKTWLGLESRGTIWRWVKGNRSFPVEMELFVTDSHASNAIAVKKGSVTFAWETSRPERKFRIVCEQETMKTMPTFFKTLNESTDLTSGVGGMQVSTRRSPVIQRRNETGLREQETGSKEGLTKDAGLTRRSGWNLISSHIDDVSKMESFLLGRSQIPTNQLLTQFPARSLLQCARICLDKDFGCTGIVYSRMSCSLRVT